MQWGLPAEIAVQIVLSLLKMGLHSKVIEKRAVTLARYKKITELKQSLFGLVADHTLDDSELINKAENKIKELKTDGIELKDIKLNVQNSRQNTLLLWAAYHGRIKLFQWLIAQGASIQERTEEGYTIFLNAVRNGKLEFIIFLYATNPDVLQERDKRGNTALLLAVGCGHQAIAVWLLNHGASLNETNDVGANPIIKACAGGHIGIIDWLHTEKQLSLDVRSTNGTSPILEAAYFGHKHVVEHLHNTYQVSFDEKDHNGHTIGLNAARNGQIELIQWLLPFHASFLTETDSRTGKTAFLHAVRWGYLKTAKWLFEQGASIHAKDENGDGALSLAVIYGHLDILQWLVEEKQIPLTKNEEGILIHLAVRNGHINIVKWFLKKQPELKNAKDGSGMTPFLMAIYDGQLPIAILLLTQGVDLEARDNNKNTAVDIAVYANRLPMLEFLYSIELFNPIYNLGTHSLKIAVQLHHPHIVEWLLNHVHYSDVFIEDAMYEAVRSGHLDILQYLVTQKGASLTKTDASGKSLFNIASEKGHTSIVEWLLASQFSYDKDIRGFTPLMNAVYNGHVVIVHKLIENSVDPDVTNREGKTALDIAREREKGNLTAEQIKKNDQIINLLDNYMRKKQRPVFLSQTELRVQELEAIADREMLAQAAEARIRLSAHPNAFMKKVNNQLPGVDIKPDISSQLPTKNNI